MKRVLVLQANYVVTFLIFLGLFVVSGIPVMIFLGYLHPRLMAYAAGYAYGFAIWLVFAGMSDRGLPVTRAKRLMRASIVVGFFILLHLAYSAFSQQISAFLGYDDPSFTRQAMYGPLFLLLVINWRLLFRWGLPEERQTV